jgi:hypothetical protein
MCRPIGDLTGPIGPKSSCIRTLQRL